MTHNKKPVTILRNGYNLTHGCVSYYSYVPVQSQGLSGREYCMSENSFITLPFTTKGANVPGVEDSDAKVEETKDVKTESKSSEDSNSQVEAHKEVDETNEDQKPKGQGIQKRISELTRGRREAERAAVKLQQQVAELKSKVKQLSKPEAKNFNGKPDEYVESLLDYKNTVKEVEKTSAKEQAAIVKAQEALKTEFNEKLKDFAEKHQDAYEVISKVPSKIFDDRLAYNIMNGESSAELAYYLAKNLNEAAELSEMDDLGLSRALGRLEAKIAASASGTASKPVETKKTKAEKPITPIRSGDVSKTTYTKEELGKMSFTEYENATKGDPRNRKLNW